MRKGTILAVIVLLLALAGVAGAKAFPDTVPLPDNFNPEGVTMGYGTHIYAGSLAGGAIYRADVRTGEGEVLFPGAADRWSVGMDFDRRTGYLYVAGGPTGNAYIYDTNGGPAGQPTVIPLATAPTFVNDVIVTEHAAYFTESAAPVLYRLDLATQTATTIALDDDFPRGFPFNSNGIVTTPGERWLVIAHSGNGSLHRVDPATGDTEEIDLGPAGVATPDGLERVGNTIYAVQNFLDQIAEVKMAGDYLSGEVAEDVIEDEDFDIPTTATKFGNALYAVNARFTTPDAVEFDIVRVER